MRISLHRQLGLLREAIIGIKDANGFTVYDCIFCSLNFGNRKDARRHAIIHKKKLLTTREENAQ